LRKNDVPHTDLDNVRHLIEICAMNSLDLKAILKELGLTQADLARLLGITPRAVTLWMADARAIPGPAEAYIRLLRLLPANLRQIELSRLKQKGSKMRDGLYRISFQGRQGAGMGVLVFEEGRIYGTDTEGVRYDGEYLFDEHSGLADVKLKVTFPPNVRAVFGVSNPYEWSFDVTTHLNPKQDSGPVSVKTSIGQTIDAQFAYLRGLPDAA
jgi:DNA-binding transcriptional regulator YiaG